MGDLDPKACVLTHVGLQLACINNAKFNGRLSNVQIWPYQNASVLLYHPAYESGLVFTEPLFLVCAVTFPSSGMRYTQGLERINHIPPFFFLSSALAFRADRTSGARVLSGSDVWMKGCYECVSE